MVKYETDLSINECRTIFKECTDFVAFSFGEERLTGWIQFGFFSISYRSGKFRMYNPIFIKAIGKLTECDGRTLVKFSIYKGLTDIFSILYITTPRI